MLLALAFVKLLLLDAVGFLFFFPKKMFLFLFFNSLMFLTDVTDVALQVQVRDQNITWMEAARGGNYSGAPSVKWWFWETESAGLSKTPAINR